MLECPEQFTRRSLHSYDNSTNDSDVQRKKHKKLAYLILELRCSVQDTHMRVVVM